MGWLGTGVSNILYIFIFITILHRYREDIDTTIYNMYNIYSIEHKENSWTGGHTLSFMIRIN